MSDFVYNDWVTRWQRTIEAVRRVARPDDCRLELSAPARSADVSLIERELGFLLPDSFKEVMLNFSAAVDFFWFLGAFAYPSPFEFISHGNCLWDLKSILSLEADRLSWLDFSDGDDSPYEILRDKMIFMNVGNGDKLAIDLGPNSGQPVIYIASHFDDEIGHGYLLGENFADFIDRWTRLGCVGAEISQMLDFTSGPRSYLEPETAFAMQWSKVLGI